MPRQLCITCGVLFGLLLLGVATRGEGQAVQPAPKLLYRIGAAGIGHGSRLDYVEFSADGRFVATAAEFDDNSICVWDLATGVRCFRMKLGHMIGCTGVTLSRDGKQVASFVTQRSIDSNAMIFDWDVASGKQRQAVEYGRWKLHRRAALAFSPDGKLLAVGGTDVKLIDLITGEIQTTLVPESEVSEIAFHKDGRLIATSGKDVQFWDPITGKPRGRLGVQKCWGGIFNPDGTVMGYILDGTTFNLRSITVPADATKPVAFGPVQELAKFPLAQKRQAFSQDGKKILLSGNIYECQEFEVATGKLIQKSVRRLDKTTVMRRLDGVLCQ